MVRQIYLSNFDFTGYLARLNQANHLFILTKFQAKKCSGRIQVVPSLGEWLKGLSRALTR
jgi:hypothetical protein